jgi:primosomal protein N' (replication factor Y)
VRSSPTLADRLVTVGVPVPGLPVLTYRVPGPLVPPKGARVRVPIGPRTVVGCVVDAHAPAPPPGTKVKDITEALDDDGFVPPAVVDLALWVAEYYAAGPGDALALALPPAARQGRGNSFRTETVVRLTADAGAPSPGLRGPKQRDALSRLSAAGGALSSASLRDAGISAATVKSLQAARAVDVERRIIDRDPFAESGGTPAPWAVHPAFPPVGALTDEQAAALSALIEIAERGAFRTVLLHGVTGSGKTEVYLRLADAVIALGRQVLVLVPEIALTPAAAGRFRARFGSRVAIQHSGLSSGERHDQWHRIRRAQVDVVVGTRSAVFAPLERLGLIVVDEEHDTSYKQDEAPRYHGRDVAVMRGRMAGALVVLGSATPSLESAANAEAGRYDRLAITRRVLDRPLATVRIVDMRQEYAARGADVTFSAPLLEALGDRLARGEQSVVLLNRRGFATVVFCRQCGATMDCPHCSVGLTYHRAAHRVRCHYCDHSAALPRACPACRGAFLEQSGFGTERLEADLRSAFPTARLARVDRDTIRRRGAIVDVLASVARGEVDILIGTQMIAKGHDFPAVTLVGVVSADVGLGMADFRAAERTFQLVTQVVGRAGRGVIPGEAIVQSLHPDHYSIRAAAAQDYQAFYAREIDYRRKLQYPPTLGLINVIVKHRSIEQAMADARDLAARVRREGGVRVVGPAPAALAKVKDECRAQVLLKSGRRAAMREALLRALAARPDLRRRTIVDVDPLSVL